MSKTVISAVRCIATGLLIVGCGLWTADAARADIASCKANCTDPTSELTCRFYCDQAFGDEPRGGSRGPLLPSQDWAYIVYDIKSGVWGAKSKESNGQAAMAAARQACRARGGRQCEWRLSGRDGCVAVAHGDNNTGLSAHRTSRNRGGRKAVQRQVLQACERDGGRHCRIVASVCSWD